ncbi:hypothetical protein COV61_02285, partial [Candidatus Micrarchaeota archaeon CG11_big_fil_rev_8_21_14_0_20_47_5]
MAFGRNEGIVFAFAAALISGISVFANGAAVKLAEPLAYTLLKNIGAFIFLAAVVLFLGEWRSFKALSRKQWLYLLLIGVIGGSIPFALFFTGLKLGGALVSSFIFRSLFIFAGVFGYFILKEKPTGKEMLAGFTILVGNALLLPPQLSFGFPQLLVFAATLLWALEYTISRKAMADTPPRVVMISRMFFGSLVLIAFMVATNSAGALLQINAELLQWLFITSLLLSAFLLTWYNALARLPVLKATAIFALGGVVTAVLETALAGRTLAPLEAFSLFLIAIGAFAFAGAIDAL